MKVNLQQTLAQMGLRSQALIGQLKAMRTVTEATVQQVIRAYTDEEPDVSQLVLLVKAEQTGNAFIAVQRDPYLINTVHASEYPNDRLSTAIEQIVNQVFENRDSEVIARACAALNWTLRNFTLDMNAVGEIAKQERTTGHMPTVGEYTTSVNGILQSLNPPPKFDADRFGGPDSDLTPISMAAISYALGEEILLPNGVLPMRIGHVGDSDTITLIDPNKSFMAVTPGGREVRVLFQYPIRGQLGSIMANSTYVFLPVDFIEPNNQTNQAQLVNYRNYAGNRIARSCLQLSGRPAFFPQWCMLHFIGSSNDVNEDRLHNDVLEMLAVSDGRKLGEAVLGRRFIENLDSDFIELARTLTKPESFLRQQLDALPEGSREQKEYAMAIESLRGSLTAIAETPNSRLLLFSELLFTSVLDFPPGAFAGEASHLIKMRELGAQLLGPKLSSTLECTNGVIDKSRWADWFPHNLQGTDFSSDRRLMVALDEKLPGLSADILREQFIDDFNAVNSDWRTLQRDWEVH